MRYELHGSRREHTWFLAAVSLAWLGGVVGVPADTALSSKASMRSCGKGCERQAPRVSHSLVSLVRTLSRLVWRGGPGCKPLSCITVTLLAATCGQDCSVGFAVQLHSRHWPRCKWLVEFHNPVFLHSTHPCVPVREHVARPKSLLRPRGVLRFPTL